MATGVDFAIFSIYSWEFNSSLEMDDETTNPVSNPKSRRKNITALVVGLCLGGGFLVGGVVLIIWLAGIGRKRKEGDEEDNQGFSEYIDDEFERGAAPKRFPYKELALATNDFNDDQKLGQGGSKQGIKEYASEVKIISRLRHKNLVQLLGWCHEKNELLLVYEVMPNGSCRWKMAHDLSDGEEQGFDRGIQEPVHILAYYSSCGPSKYEELENLLGNIRDGRFLRAKDMILKLNKLKLPLKWENVAKIAGKGVAPGRLHVARAMVEAGHVENLKQAFADISMMGDMHTPHETDYKVSVCCGCRGSQPLAEVAVELIHRTSGLAVLAHPWALKNPAAIIRKLKDVGLHGLEVYRSDGKLVETELKHGKAVVRRKGLFRDIRNSTYGGEATGSNPGISKSRRLKN
ncbi:hypothetical protein WN944_024500 [Citrus x changshan-huyou]|uniref:Serine-threonine/tyrosine-protein kinase catalytic domain-containing protein n=1 Tax=Citrus x changshan-huyou TaxID=2935761 RepID=A0AAP0LQS0_9ROSI